MSKLARISGNDLPAQEHLRSRIYEVRGMHVMLDGDLAELYGVDTKVLNQAVKRNLERFPADFMFQLTATEHAGTRPHLDTAEITPLPASAALRSQSVTSNPNRGGRRYLPYAFTEQGVAMLSGVLRSERAVAVNIAIMRAFVELRRWVRAHEELARKLAALERKSDAQYRQVMEVLEQLLAGPGSARSAKDGDSGSGVKRIGFRKGQAPGRD
jgi:hypothetical protein